MICELDNPMRDPGDGTIISATNISIITYAATDCGLGRKTSTTRHGSAMPHPMVQKAQALGTLDDEAGAWLNHFGGRA